MKILKILVTGGLGYIGSVLVPELQKNHDVTVWDTNWFGCHIGLQNPLIEGDIRNLIYLGGYDLIIHLAAIANDPCGELDGKLTWEVNTLATMRLADAAVRGGVKRFIYASSASVYGLKDNKAVTEEDSLAPVSDYNKTKMVSERALLSYQENMGIQILRPATVCGFSPRMRLDTMVNMLTYQALSEGRIIAHCGEHGGDLMRPNTNIHDMVRAYLWMVDNPQLRGIYNVGFQNLSAMDTAKLIAEYIPCDIEITKVKDKRSYAVDSGKFMDTGFHPHYRVADAILEIKDAYNKGFRKSEQSINLHWMQTLGVAS